MAGDDEDGVCDVYRFLDDYVDMLSEKVFSEDDIRKELINVGICGYHVFIICIQNLLTLRNNESKPSFAFQNSKDVKKSIK